MRLPGRQEHAGLVQWCSTQRLVVDSLHARCCRKGLPSGYCTSTYLQHYLRRMAWPNSSKGHEVLLLAVLYVNPTAACHAQQGTSCSNSNHTKLAVHHTLRDACLPLRVRHHIESHRALSTGIALLALEVLKLLDLHLSYHCFALKTSDGGAVAVSRRNSAGLSSAVIRSRAGPLSRLQP
jgi:hypothetical protein